MVTPSFFQKRLGSGYPFGGPHSKTAVSPAATLAPTGTDRNSSLNTVTKIKNKNNSYFFDGLTTIAIRYCIDSYPNQN